MSDTVETTREQQAASHRRGISDVRAGAVALITSGLVLAPVPFLQSGPTNPDENMAFALAANTTAWRVSMLLAIISVPLIVLGSFALYAHLARTRARRWARAGLVFTVVMGVLIVPMYGFAGFVVPAVGVLADSGHADAVEVMSQTFEEPFIAVPFLAGVLLNLGYVLTGVAVWRSHTLWKWGGLVLVAAGVAGFPSFLDVHLAQNVTPLVFATAVVLVGCSLWARSGNPRGEGVSRRVRAPGWASPRRRGASSPAARSAC